MGKTIEEKEHDQETCLYCALNRYVLKKYGTVKIDKEQMSDFLGDFITVTGNVVVMSGYPITQYIMDIVDAYNTSVVRMTLSEQPSNMSSTKVH